MRFLVDECTGPAVARWLRGQRHDVSSVDEELRGESDERIISKAQAEERILITNDKDFGELIFRMKRPHAGVILLRLGNEQPAAKIAALQRLLQWHSKQIVGKYVVVTETAVRIVNAGE